MQQHNKINGIIKINFIFMNSENSEISEPHVLIHQLTDKLRKEVKKVLLYQKLVITIHGKT